MASKDIFNLIKVLTAFKQQVINTDTTTTGEEIDTAGFESVVLTIQAGTITLGDATPLLEEADDNGSGAPDTFAAVADADMIPDVAAEAGAKFEADDDDEVHKIGYRGDKRWLRLKLVTDNSANMVIGATVILGLSRHMPEDTQKI